MCAQNPLSRLNRFCEPTALFKLVNPPVFWESRLHTRNRM